MLGVKEVEDALNNLHSCPKCTSIEGFWVITKNDRVRVQCKACGSTFEHFELHDNNEKQKARRWAHLLNH